MACTSSCCKWIHVLAFAEQVVWTAWRSSNNTMGTKPWSHCESKWCLVITVQSEFQTVMMTPACAPICLHLCHMLFCVTLAVPHLPTKPPQHTCISTYWQLYSSNIIWVYVRKCPWNYPVKYLFNVCKAKRAAVNYSSRQYNSHQTNEFMLFWKMNKIPLSICLRCAICTRKLCRYTRDVFWPNSTNKRGEDV